MESEGERYRLYSRRAALLGGFQALAFTTLMGRMYYLGVVESGQYKVLAEENRVSLRLIAPERGEIVDRMGRRIATNRKDFRVFLIPEEAVDPEKTLLLLGEIIELSEGSLARIRRQIKRQRDFLPVTVAENLSWREFARINVESVKLPGVQPDAGETRFYPDGPLASQVVGYVGPVDENEINQAPVFQLPGFKVGKSGLERSFEKNLRGQAGSRRVEVNAYGRVIRELTRQDGRPGEAMVLTLDLELQRHVVGLLGEESAAAIVMDIETGDILVKASTPSFNPNDFNLGISRENWNALIRDPRKPLVNKCLQGQYPPGSTFKMAVALAALEAGVIAAGDEVTCNGEYEFGDRVFHCWKKQGHGSLALVDSIAQSCDIYFYNLAQKVGIERIAVMARRLGLGQTYDLGIPGQADGLVPTKGWKLAISGKPWRIGETLNVAIGQGALLATPLQMAVMIARLAGGKAVKPRLVHSVGGEPTGTPEFENIGLRRSHMRLIQRSMEKVLEFKGTAFASRLEGDGLSMAGKTGTSQVRRITKAERDAGLKTLKNRPWRERDHALFVAYGPTEKPRYALSLIIEHGGGGSSVAAPLAREIMRRTLEIDPGSRHPVASAGKPGQSSGGRAGGGA